MAAVVQELDALRDIRAGGREVQGLAHSDGTWRVTTPVGTWECDRVVNAARSGGILGVGGDWVSEAERRFLSELSVALGD